MTWWVPRLLPRQSRHPFRSLCFRFDVHLAPCYSPTPPQLLAIQLVSSPLLVWVGFTTTAATIPSWTTFGVQFLVFNVVEDFGFYWVLTTLGPRVLIWGLQVAAFTNLT